MLDILTLNSLYLFLCSLLLLRLVQQGEWRPKVSEGDGNAGGVCWVQREAAGATQLLCWNPWPENSSLCAGD